MEMDFFFFLGEISVSISRHFSNDGRKFGKRLASLITALNKAWERDGEDSQEKILKAKQKQEASKATIKVFCFALLISSTPKLWYYPRSPMPSP